ncbi:hypothetical protein GHT06_016730 [Daphnia sinensis]|uniref:RCC1-like domain-containing protein n=1 Tax=Daphnia sinensis TaxID=1820382 RepID=A0AAD5PR94_9CRUS|nr:hypothetical protein GHT06_016730 [Daphnia sinensis]
MVKRKVAEVEEKPAEVAKTATKATAKQAAKPKAVAKKAKAAASPQQSPVKKVAAPKAAKLTKVPAPEPAKSKAPAAPKGKAKKATEAEDEVPTKAKRATKTVAKETTAVAKAVKAPKPKPSPAKPKKTAAVKAPKVPKVATPEKKKPATTKAKKAASEMETSSDDSPAEVINEKKNVETKKTETAEARKRPKPAKEVVAAKKPKLEIVVPFRQKRGTGMVLSMGQGDVGQLGLGPDVLEKNRPALVDQVKDVIDVVAGGMHTVCLTSKGEIYTFGCNDEGALGRDTSEEGSEFEPGLVNLPGKATLISAGDSHTAALLEDGRCFIWGTFRDSHGPMGLNESGSQKLPVPILEGIPMTQIASGADHLVCLSSDGQVYTCGCAEQGQLGRVAEVFSNRGGRKGKNYLLTPQPVALGKGKKRVVIDSVWTGSYATFARAKDTGLIYVFGLNNYNQLGLPSQDARFQPEVSDGFKGHRWQSISCGQHHTLALDENGQVYSLGRKEYGRLGMGADAKDLAVPTPIPALQSHKCVDVTAGESVSLAVTESGMAYSWGMGTNGQLGLGHEDDVLEPTTIKGKQLENRLVFLASAGGQHTVLLAAEKSSTTAAPAAATQARTAAVANSSAD